MQNRIKSSTLAAFALAAVTLILIGVVLVRSNVALVGNASSALSQSKLVPLAAINGPLASRFQAAASTQKIVLTGNASDDAELILDRTAAFWRNVKSFRVRMRFKDRPSPRHSEPQVDITAVLVGCGPCLAELPLLKQIAREFSSRGVTLLAVTDEEDTDQIRKTLTSRKLDLPIAMDIEHRSGEYGVSMIPHLVLIDREGIVRDVYVGFSPHLETELREQLAKLTRQ